MKMVVMIRVRRKINLINLKEVVNRRSMVVVVEISLKEAKTNKHNKEVRNRDGRRLESNDSDEY